MVPSPLLPNLGEMGQEIFLLPWPSPSGEQSYARLYLVVGTLDPKGTHRFTTSSLEVGALTFAPAAQ